ncbi:2OG-Fe(II) oxygenase family protein [Streptomyces ossamyceticus]|nr:2OG-Fe(II) oxygenase family protein [Streptomyces ossamyceticus]
MTTKEMTLQRARTASGELVFETGGGLSQALQDGCFYLAIPEDIDLEPGKLLCRQFYRPAHPGSPELRPYRGFRRNDGIYFDREYYQTEHILADGPAREKYLPPDVVALCERMTSLALLVLTSTLTGLGIDEAVWEKVTGGAVGGGGTQWFAASHYRPERHQLGCAPHKDTGFVTVLYIEQDGLESSVGGEWIPIAPLPGYFLVNFGGATELLTARMGRPVQAILHRVRSCVTEPAREDRFSFAVFANPPATGDLYQMSESGEPVAVRGVEEFLRDFNNETWSDRHTDFGITTTAPGEVHD